MQDSLPARRAEVRSSAELGDRFVATLFALIGQTQNTRFFERELLEATVAKELDAVVRRSNLAPSTHESGLRRIATEDSSENRHSVA
jgi:hypothetical protein